MGKALYRKYRPTTLDTVIGQEHITNTLKNALKKGSVSHAYLFTGPRGVGKTTVARILAHEINEIPYDEKITQLDIIEIDAASNRRIDEIRNLREKVHIAPTSCKYKVYIIDEVHMLTREAFNALLKTLEEPPDHVVFILATTESHKVPETIISRTQRFSFKPLDKESVAKHLRTIANKEKIKITDESLMLIAEYGNGSFRDSISMLDQIAGFSESEITVENINSLLGSPDEILLQNIINAVQVSDVDSIFKDMQKLRENGTNPAKTAQSLIKILRSDLISKKTILESYKSVKLMKLLLPLTGVQSSFEAIEICLLDCVQFDSVANSQNISSKSELALSEPENIPKINNEIIDMSNESEIILEIPNTESENIVETTTDSNNTWNSVLEALKANNNTLYGVLRMAETQIDNNKITLIFQFEFHKKQLNQTKNISTLKSIINEQFGAGYSIESEVVKKQKIEPKKEEKSSDDTLSNVSNIFGGAELLES